METSQNNKDFREITTVDPLFVNCLYKFLQVVFLWVKMQRVSISPKQMEPEMKLGALPAVCKALSLAWLS